MTSEIVDMVEALSNEMANGKGDLATNTAYYEAEHRVKALGLATPPEMRNLEAAFGWNRTYLDSVEERLDLEGFRMLGDSYGDERLWSWWQSNNLDVEAGLGHTEAMMHGVSYITVSAPAENDIDFDSETPIIRVESPRNMIAKRDPRTRRVKHALRLYDSPMTPADRAATLYLPNQTLYLSGGGRVKGWKIDEIVNHNLGVVPVVPMLNRERLSDRLGRSEITRELRSVTDAASRVMMNMQVGAELMAVPQRLLFGVTEEEFAADPSNPGAVFEAYMARILAFENEGGRAEQFTAAELRNFTEVLEYLAKLFATYTGLPPQYMSFNSENPASAEAIKSAESRLVKKAERKAKQFGAAWEQVMRLALLIIDGSVPKAAYRMESLWRDPSTPTYAAKADGVTKLYSNGTGVIPLERARIDMGYTPEERKEMRKWDKQNPMGQLNAILGGNPADSEESDKPDNLT